MTIIDGKSYKKLWAKRLDIFDETAKLLDKYFNPNAKEKNSKVIFIELYTV